MKLSSRSVAVSVVVLVGLGLTLAAWRGTASLVRQEGALRGQQAFQGQATAHLVMVEREIERQLGVARGLQAYFEASDLVTSDELGRFLGRQARSAAGWIAAGTCTRAPDGRCTLSLVHPADAPFPGAVDGVLSAPGLAEVDTAVTVLPYGDESARTFAIAGRIRAQSPDQLIVVVIDAVSLVEAGLAGGHPETDGFSVAVYDQDPVGVPRHIITHPADAAVLSLDAATRGAHLRFPLDVGGRTWAVIARPGGATAPFRGALPLVALLGGLLITSLMAGWVSALVGRASTVAGLVDARTEQLVATTRELASNEALLRAIVETTVDGILVFDRDGRVQSANPAAAAIFGYDRADLLGRSVFDLLPEPYRDRHRRALDRFLETGEAPLLGHRREVAGLRPDGEVFPMDLTVTELQTMAGRRFMAVIADVSQRRLIDRLKGEFLSTVNHELRTPLTSIIGSLELLRDGLVGPLPARAQRFADLAYDNSERLLRIVNDILDVERLGSGRVELERTALDGAALVRRAVEMHAALAERQGVALVEDPATRPVEISADADRLMQVLANLISNAVRFSPAAGSVYVGVRDEGGEGLFWVRDEGPGIPAAFRERVFVPFSQADGSDSRHVGGTGLGLSIARAIVEAHGGVIWFDTHEGAGTTFLFRVPQAVLAGVDDPDMVDTLEDEDE